jgi:hypothetical protein
VEEAQSFLDVSVCECVYPLMLWRHFHMWIALPHRVAP